MASIWFVTSTLKQFSCPTQQSSDAKDAKSPSHQAVHAEQNVVPPGQKHLENHVHIATAWALNPGFSFPAWSQCTTGLGQCEGLTNRAHCGHLQCLSVLLMSQWAGRNCGILNITGEGCPVQPCLLPVPLVVSPQPAPEPTPHPLHLCKQSHEGPIPKKANWSGPSRGGKMGPWYRLHPCPAGYECIHPGVVDVHSDLGSRLQSSHRTFLGHKGKRNSPASEKIQACERGVN